MKKILYGVSIITIIALVGVYFIFWPKVRLSLAIDPRFSMFWPNIVGGTAEVTQCELSCCNPSGCRCCTGGEWCMTRPIEKECLMHSNVSAGTASGLYLNKDLIQAGVTNGQPILSGGPLPAMMESGVVGGFGGCVGTGCVAVNKNIFQRYAEIIKYGIASFKNKE